MSVYDTVFYREHQDGSRRSASIILPMLFEILRPSRVVDVGCGVGSWLSVARSLGAEIIGLDGDYVDRKLLEIPTECFIPADLTKPFPLNERFDLALCLEVGEHLPASSAETLVRSLTSLSEAVAFSAAIPMQGGSNHVNEQWQSYWVALFAKCGYEPVDFIRSRVWSNEGVEDFYAQNLILYCSESLLRQNAAVNEKYESSPRRMFDLVHPKRYLYNMDVETMSTKKLIKAIPGKTVKGILYRLRRLFKGG